jgi:hypothetical protein
MADNYQGSCACGKVRFAVDAEPLNSFNCHCTICRKMNGSAFSTYVVFPQAALRITAGMAEIRAAEVGTHGTRHFCSLCGTPLYGLHRLAAGLCLVVLGAFDDTAALVPTANVFCRSRLPWTFELGSLVNHETTPSG